MYTRNINLTLKSEPATVNPSKPSKLEKAYLSTSPARGVAAGSAMAGDFIRAGSAEAC